MIEDEQEDKDVRSEDQMHAEQRMREERSVKLLLGERPRKSSPMKAAPPPRPVVTRKSLPQLLQEEPPAPVAAAAAHKPAPVVQQEEKQAEVAKAQPPEVQSEQPQQPQQPQEETKPLSAEHEEPAKPEVHEEEHAKTVEEVQGTPEVKEETEQKDVETQEKPQTTEPETTPTATVAATETGTSEAEQETKPQGEEKKEEKQKPKTSVLTPKMPETTGSATAKSLERAGASPHSSLTVDADSTVESPMATVLARTPRGPARSSSPGTGLAAADEGAGPAGADRVAEAFGIDFAAEDEDSAGMEPMTLPEAFEAIVTAAVTASGVNELPFVKDFLAAYRISMSTSTLFSDYSPLGEGALEQLRGVGRTLWRVFSQQRVIGAVTECQSLLSSNRVRHRCEAPRARVWRNKASVAWLRSTIALRNHERQLILSLENSERSAALQRVLEVHQDAFYRLDDMCIQFPAPSAFALGTLAKTWADEALLAYMELYGELQQCKEDAAAAAAAATSTGTATGSSAAGTRTTANAQRRAFLQALWDRLGDYHATLADNCTLYKTMLLYISVTDPISSLMENDIRQLEDCVAAFATLPARAVELHCMSRKQQCAVESAIKTRKRGSSSADVRRHNCKKLASELLQTVLDPAALPPSDTREVQFHGTVRAVVDRASDPVVHHKFHRLRWCLLTDAFVLFSAGPVPTLLATIMLRDCLLYDIPTTGATGATGSTGSTGSTATPGDKHEASFVLVTQEHRITCKHWKPGRLHRTMRANIARLRVFGVDLGDLVAFEHDITGIPRVALKCMEYVEQHGFSCEGIFRVNGKVSVMEALRAAFNARSRDIDFSGVNAYDVAQLFKKFAFHPSSLLRSFAFSHLLLFPGSLLSFQNLCSPLSAIGNLPS